MESGERPARVQRVAPYEPGSGLPRSDEALQGIGRMFGGYVPNLHRVLARSPASVEAFEAMRRLLQDTKISALERELVAIEVSRRSGCAYCMTAHTYFADRFKLSPEDVERARVGEIVSDPRLGLVQRATHRLLDRKGRLSDEELAGFRGEGLGDDELIEIISIIGWYVTSTYTNNLAQTEIDAFFTPKK